jgi:hypothetical protein
MYERMKKRKREKVKKKKGEKEKRKKGRNRRFLISSPGGPRSGNPQRTAQP